MGPQSAVCGMTEGRTDASRVVVGGWSECVRDCVKRSKKNVKRASIYLLVNKCLLVYLTFFFF